MAENPVENQEIIEEWSTQNIAKFSKYLTASKIQYYLEFQEYSNISETGFASVYDVSGWKESKTQEAFFMTNI
ncbi:unnamed protein product [Rhizophagus irregularis]|nr:unnamed protein product [Rhizophagus irregularis]CAB4445328.1 unnamed protein product [Rhizophagus irregularis]